MSLSETLLLAELEARVVAAIDRANRDANDPKRDSTAFDAGRAVGLREALEIVKKIERGA